MRSGPLILGVLASGRGSNLQAILDAIDAGRCPARVGRRRERPEGRAGPRARAPGRHPGGARRSPRPPGPRGLRRRGRGGPRRARRRAGLSRRLHAGALAGLRPALPEAAILNVHPALLPAFPGLHAQRQALEHGVKVAGATVHFVDEERGHGADRAAGGGAGALDDDTEETLAARILAEEHRLYPEAIRLLRRGAPRGGGPPRAGAGEARERRVRRALLSVSDKSGLVDLARGLADLGVELLSTGGTARALAAAGLPVREVADVTGFPEMLDGRVKTLHPAIHGGILARRDLPAHEEALARHGIGADRPGGGEPLPVRGDRREAGSRPSRTRSSRSTSGGPAMIRAAAKNHAGVVVLVDPAQYAPVLEELRRIGRHGVGGHAAAAGAGGVPPDGPVRRGDRRLAPGARPVGDARRRATPLRFPPVIHLEAERVTALRYGENPHQQAAFYRPLGPALGIGRPRRAPPAPRARALATTTSSTSPGRSACCSSSPSPPPSSSSTRTPAGPRSGPTSARRSSAPAPPIPSRSTGGSSASTGPSTGVWSRPWPGSCSRSSSRRRSSRTRSRSSGAPRRSCACSRCPSAGRPPARRPSRFAASPAALLVQEADLAGLDPVTLRVVSRRQPTAGRVARPPLRLEGRQAREVQRDRAGVRGAGAGRRRGADEPGGRGAPRGDAGARARPQAGGRRRSPPTRSSRSGTGSTSWPRRAPPP